MARVLVTGSTAGLGLGAALELGANGHDVIFHARRRDRAGDIPKDAALVIGDLSEPDDVRALVAQINELAPLDAVIHNAALGSVERTLNSQGHPTLMAVNVYAPYMLTALLARPQRIVYLTSGLHLRGDAGLDDLDWSHRRWNGHQAYCDSKLLVTTFAFAIARLWPSVLSNAVHPGWVPTRMGGPSATDDLLLGHRTQAWLAVSDDPSANVSGEYWFHQRTQAPAKQTRDVAYQQQLIDRLQEITGVSL